MSVSVRQRAMIGAVAFFVVIFALLLPARVREPITGDAASYNNAAINLVRSFFYSQDGKVPFVEREPGESVWLAMIYALFGIDNRTAAFVAQALLYLVACIAFTRALERETSARVATICFALLLVLPSVYHVILSFTRESLALSFFLLSATFFLRWQRGRHFHDAAFSGLFLGSVIITYAVYLFFPVFLIPLIWHLKLPWKHFAIFLFCSALIISFWGVRNYRIRGRPCLTGCTRSAEYWYVRGVQAEKIHAFTLEPLWCLWSEYVSRDWTGRSDACSYNGVRNARWPTGFTGLDEDLLAGREGRQKILAHLPSYLWFSLFEVLELHLPYVNGWGRLYNLLTAIGSLALYVGCALALPLLKRKETLILLWIPLYTLLAWIFTDATPRYLIPAIFCYATFAAVGYSTILGRKIRNSKALNSK